jgi:N-acetylglucosaminyl-diphospho-decaprenol L-rhamnosyltransferase
MSRAECADHPVVAVVVVTFSVDRCTLDRCLRSVVASGDADMVIVVDNGDRAVIADDLEADVELVRTGHNGGFGAAANVGFGIAATRGVEFVALLNDDVVVEAGWLGSLIDVLTGYPQLGAVQPKLLLTGSDPVLVNSVGVELGPDGAGRDVGYGELDDERTAEARDIDIFTGGAVLLRREFVEDLGGFDERYFLYYEDVDLALRGAERGWRYRCEPLSVVWHAPGTSTSLVGKRVAELRERNRLWTAVRFGSPRTIRGALWLSARRLIRPPYGVHARGLGRGLAAVPRLVVGRIRARRGCR